MKISTAEKALYISYNSDLGPYSAGLGYVYRLSSNGTLTNITPPWVTANSLTPGYGGLALDAQHPGTLMVAAMNLWWPDVQIFRSNNSVSRNSMRIAFHSLTETGGNLVCDLGFCGWFSKNILYL